MEFSSMQQRLVGSAFDTPSFVTDVDGLKDRDSSQMQYVEEYNKTGDIPEKMRACVNCVGSCGLKEELMVNIGSTIPTNDVPLGTGCFGVIGGYSLKIYSIDGSVSRTTELHPSNNSGLQHVGYYNKNFLRNMTVEKAYLCLRQYGSSSGIIDDEITCRIQGKMVDIGGTMQLCSTLKAAKIKLAEEVDKLLEKRFSIAYFTNTKTHAIIKSQDLRTTIKGKLISFKSCSTIEEYREMCFRVNEEYSKIVDAKIKEFEEADEEQQNKDIDRMIESFGLTEYVREEYASRNLALSYLFPNINRYELYRNYVSDHAGESV